MNLQLLTDATADPVTLEELKQHIRLSTADTSEDAILSAYIKTASTMAAHKTGRAFMPQQWKLYLDSFPGGTEAITIPFTPLSSSATDVVITFNEDASGDSTTLASTAYTIDYVSEPPKVYPSYGNDWPDNVRDIPNAVQVVFVAGYPLTSSSGASTKIEAVKSWIKIRAAGAYEYREPIIEGKIVTELKRDFVDGLLDPFIVPKDL
jgi:uncharacterized phiE125 gp8 family phage protein